VTEELVEAFPDCGECGAELTYVIGAEPNEVLK
jgi:hypothetical protein